jgi:uncharacterized protein with GYD domain
MPKFMATAKYTPQALQGVRKDGYQSRQPALEKLAESLGGKLEQVYFAVSPNCDLVAIMELPDSAAAFALLSMANASGVTQDGDVFELLSPTQADAAISGQIQYIPPGQT